jgi:hypothetical protein
MNPCSDHANFRGTHQCGGYEIHNDVQAADIKDMVCLPLKEKVVPYRKLGLFHYLGRLMRRAYLDVTQSIFTAVQGTNTKKNTDLNT